jgi:hypothetical protein
MSEVLFDPIFKNNPIALQVLGNRKVTETVRHLPLGGRESLAKRKTKISKGFLVF